MSSRAILARSRRRRADAHAAQAAKEAPPAARLNNWREARVFYQRSLDLYLELRTRNSVPPAQSNAIDEIKRDITRCDAALGKQ